MTANKQRVDKIVRTGRELAGQPGMEQVRERERERDKPGDFVSQKPEDSRPRNRAGARRVPLAVDEVEAARGGVLRAESRTRRGTVVAAGRAVCDGSNE